MSLDEHDICQYVASALFWLPTYMHASLLPWSLSSRHNQRLCVGDQITGGIEPAGGVIATAA